MFSDEDESRKDNIHALIPASAWEQIDDFDASSATTTLTLHFDLARGLADALVESIAALLPESGMDDETIQSCRPQTSPDMREMGNESVRLFAASVKEATGIDIVCEYDQPRRAPLHITFIVNKEQAARLLEIKSEVESARSRKNVAAMRSDDVLTGPEVVFLPSIARQIQKCIETASMDEENTQKYYQGTTVDCFAAARTEKYSAISRR